MTDDLDMGAIIKHYDIKTAIRQILLADIDITLICHKGPNIELDGAGEEIEILAQGFEQAVGVPRVMGTELGIVVLAHAGGRNEPGDLGDVVGAPHAHKDTPLQVVVATVTSGKRLDQGRNVVRIAGDDLDKPVFTSDQGLLVDTPGIGFAEPGFTTLCQIAPRPADLLVVELLVLVSRRGAVDDHGGPLESLYGLQAHLVTQFLERVVGFILGNSIDVN